MKRHILILALMALTALSTWAAETAIPEQSLKLPLTEQLKKESIPWFVSRTRNDSTQFTKKHLEELAKEPTKRIAIVFFASWCIPCKDGVVRLRDNQAELEKNGVHVVLVNNGENDLPKMESWLQANASDKWTVIVDKFKNLQKNTGLITNAETEIVFPKTILLDNKLKTIHLIGMEGKDWPAVLWQ